jgi:hypothetical protein
MEKQTFAQLLWLLLPATLVGSTAIKGLDTWLLRQVHRVNVAPACHRKRGIYGDR